MEHKYYIVKCYNNDYELNYKYLEKHLKKLNVIPDENAMDIIKILDLDEFKKKNKNIDTYCLYKNLISLPKFNKEILTADVFFLNINNNQVNKRFYDFPKYLVNIPNLSLVERILNKSNIIKEINKINPDIYKKYVPVNFNINEIDKYKFPKWYILRPIDSFAGADIKYINNKKELDDAIEYYNKTRNYKNIIYRNDVLASEYIDKPLLFRTKKFHLRLYYQISIINGIFNSFLWDTGKIVTAAEPFDMTKPFTKDKHDTHLKSTDDDYIFPTDFISKNLNKELDSKIHNQLWNKIISIMKPISKILEKNKNNLLYSNEKNMYYIFGVDIMVRDNFDPVFIEVNIGPATGAIKTHFREILSEKLFDWLNDTVLEPLFRHNDALIARKHHTYIKI